MTTPLHERAQEYLRLRRALGFRLRHEGYILPQFAGYLEQRGAVTVTAEHAIAWAQLPRGVHPVTWTHRLSAVRGFAAWLRTIDPATEIPPKGVFPGQGRRPAPFIFTSGDLAAVIDGCALLRPAMRAAACTALFGLIAVTGVRIGRPWLSPARRHRPGRRAAARHASQVTLPAGPPAAPHHRRRARGLRRPPGPAPLPGAAAYSSCPRREPHSPAARADVIPEGLRRGPRCPAGPGSMTRGTASRLILCWSGTGPVKTSPRRCRPCRDTSATRPPKGHSGISRLFLS